jgi:hypothetical protein
MADTQSRRSKGMFNTSLFRRSKKLLPPNLSGTLEQLSTSTPTQVKAPVKEQIIEITDSIEVIAEESSAIIEGMRKSTGPLEAFGDTERTLLRYKSAVGKLEEALQFRRANWKTFEVPNFGNFQGDPIPQLQEQINKMLNARQHQVKSKGVWSKGKHLMERSFKALSPLAKNLLIMSQDASSVRALFIIQPLTSNRYQGQTHLACSAVHFLS